MFISKPEETEAVQRIYKSTADAQGFVMNLAAAWAWRPEVYEAFAALRAQLTSAATLTRRDQALLVCAMASQLGDAYCSLAWGKALAREVGAAPAAAILQGVAHADLSARDLALVGWARKVTRDPNSTQPGDVATLRDAGFDDRSIFEVTAFIAFRLAFSTVNDALGCTPDWQLVDAVPAEVRAAVGYGRTPDAAPADRPS